MTLAFNNIFKGKQVVQQAWYGNKIQIFQSAGWETTPMTVQQVWAKSLASKATDIQVDSDDNFYVLRDGRVEKYNSDGELIYVYPETMAGSFVIDNKDRLIVSRTDGYIARYFKNQGFDAQFNATSNTRWLVNMHVDNDDNVFANYGVMVYMISHDFQGATKLGDAADSPGAMILDKDNNIYCVYYGSSWSPKEIDKYDSKMKIIWTKSLSYVGSALAIDSQGFVYVGQGSGDVVKLRPDNGKLVNSIVTTDSVVVDLAIDSQDNLYVATSGGNVRKYSSDGTEIWGYDGVGCTAMTIDSNNNVYVGDTSGKIVKQLQLKQEETK